MSESEAMKEKIFILLAKKASVCGLSNLSLNDIALEAGIKKPSLYNYWQSREELINDFFNFWTLRFTDMAYFKNSSKSMEEMLDLGAYDILTYYINHGLTYLLSSPLREAFVVIDTEKYIHPLAKELFHSIYCVLFRQIKELLLFFNEKGKMRMDDFDSATVLLLSYLIEHIRIISHPDFQDTHLLTINSEHLDHLLKHYVSLYPSAVYEKQID